MKLLISRILRLIANDPGFADAQPSHILERDQVDGLRLDQSVDFLRRIEILERVQKRSHRREDLFEHRAGPEPIALATGHQRSRDDDSLDLSRFELLGRQSHSHIRLS